MSQIKRSCRPSLTLYLLYVQSKSLAKRPLLPYGESHPTVPQPQCHTKCSPLCTVREPTCMNTQNCFMCHWDRTMFQPGDSCHLLTGSPRHLPNWAESVLCPQFSNAPGQALAGQSHFKAGSDSGLEEAASLPSHSKSPGAGLERLAKPQPLLYNIQPFLFSRKISKATTLGFLGQEIHSQDQQFL